MSFTRINRATEPTEPVATLTLIAGFERSQGLRLPSLDELVGAIRVQRVKARESALLQGEDCRDVFVVRHGLFKQSFVAADGRERIKSFAAEGSLFACPTALAGRGPAGFSSVAIEPGVVERVPFPVLEDLAERSVAWQKALRLAFQWLSERKVQRERELLSCTPVQRWLLLQAEAPHWLARVSQKDLAAYLGVTAVGLNRIIHRPATP